MKRCPICNILKDDNDFHRSRSGKLAGYCKPCNKIKCKEYDQKRKLTDKNFLSNERKRAIQRRQVDKNYRIGQMFHSIKKSSEKRNISLNITREFIHLMVELSQWKCVKTGIPFDLTAGEGKKPFGPTVDRINNDRGYEPDNIQIVCNIYNYAKNEFDDKTVLEFATALMEQQK